jgi:ArsR family metal-binding transcriptional regulator
MIENILNKNDYIFKMITKISKLLDNLEKKYPPPRYVKKIKNLEFKKLKNAIEIK